MAGGPLLPYSIYPDTTGRVFPGAHIGATNSRVDNGIRVQASLGANATVYLRWQIPKPLPYGTPKLRLLALAAATSGAAKINPAWVSLDPATNENPDTATYTAEGTQTITWSTGDSDDYKELKVPLDADTVVAGEIVAMNLTFETTSWTLAVISTWMASIIWE